MQRKRRSIPGGNAASYPNLKFHTNLKYSKIKSVAGRAVSNPFNPLIGV
jgi:hypothetical protein